jgi:hypothetical protein
VADEGEDGTESWCCAADNDEEELCCHPAEYLVGSPCGIFTVEELIEVGGFDTGVDRCSNLTIILLVLVGLDREETKEELMNGVLQNVEAKDH